MALRRLFCKDWDLVCPDEDTANGGDNGGGGQVDGAGGAQQNDDDDGLSNDNIDFVEEDPGQQNNSTCIVDPTSGSFGATGTGGEKDYVQPIVYQYQVQTVVNLTANDFVANKLPVIEQALSDFLVSDIFLGSLCDDGGGRRRRMTTLHLPETWTHPGAFTKVDHPTKPNPHQRRGLVELPLGASDIDGLDSKPTDLIAPGLDGVRCRTSLVPGAERCFVVNGGFTLHGFADITWAVPVALEIVKQHMDNGDLNSVDSHVVDVRFLTTGAPAVDDDTNLYPPPPTSGAEDDPSQASSASPAGSPLTWPWVVLGCGIVLFVASVVMWRRRRRSEIDEAASLDSAEKALYDPEAIDDPYLQDTKLAVRPSSLHTSPMLLPNSSTSPRVFQSPSEDESEDESDAGLMYRQRQRHFI